MVKSTELPSTLMIDVVDVLIFLSVECALFPQATRRLCKRALHSDEVV